MANEIQATIGLTASKGGATISTSSAKTADMAEAKMLTNVQNIGTSAEAITLVDIGANVGYVAFKNLDPTNYVELALDSGVSTQIFAKLMPGDVTIIKAKTATMYAKANTAACNLLVSACEV